VSHDNLGRMANQIGTFFDSMPDRDEALEGLAMHLKKFWAPGMRRALLAQADIAGNHDLMPIVMTALQRHRALIEPAAA
jgi:formate dehydrogenase subunit delta